MGSESHQIDSIDLRLTRDWLEVGIVGIVFFAAMAVFSIVAAAFNIDGSFRHPIIAAVVFGSFWSGLTLLSCWMIAAYYRHRLCADRTVIRVTNCFRAREFKLDDIEAVDWRCKTGEGTLILNSASTRLKVRFGNYTYQERAMLIQFLRERLAELPQKGWEQFESRCMPPTADYKTVKMAMRGHMRFATVAWGIAIPVMYAILIWLKLNNGSPDHAWFMIALMPPMFAAFFLGMMWLTGRMALAKADVRQPG